MRTAALAEKDFCFCCLPFTHFDEGMVVLVRWIFLSGTSCFGRVLKGTREWERNSPVCILSLSLFYVFFLHALCFNQRVYKICLWLNDMRVTFFIRINLFKNTIKMQFIYSMCALNSSFNVKIILAGFKIQNVLMYYLKKKKLN